MHGHSRTVIKLAYNIACWAFKEKHSTLFTTTVKNPITNLAAVPYILKGGGRKVGNIDEIYPVIGQINSDIYKLEADDFYKNVATSKLGSFLEKSYVDF